MNRRSFLSYLAAAPVAFVFGVGRFALAAAQIVSESDKIAAGLQYVHDAKKAPKRTNKEALCSNCMFYGMGGVPEVEVKSAGYAGKANTCSLFPGKSVASGGWCMSWTKKAT